MSAGEIFVPAACLFPPQAPIRANNPFFLLQRTKPTRRRPRERSAPIPPLDPIPPLEGGPEPSHIGGSRRRLSGLGAVVIMASAVSPLRSEPFPSRGQHPVTIPKQVLLAVGHFIPASGCRASRSPSTGWGASMNPTLTAVDAPARSHGRAVQRIGTRPGVSERTHGGAGLAEAGCRSPLPSASLGQIAVSVQKRRHQVLRLLM